MSGRSLKRRAQVGERVRLLVGILPRFTIREGAVTRTCGPTKVFVRFTPEYEGLCYRTWLELVDDDLAAVDAVADSNDLA